MLCRLFFLPNMVYLIIHLSGKAVSCDLARVLVSLIPSENVKCRKRLQKYEVCILHVYKLNLDLTRLIKDFANQCAWSCRGTIDLGLVWAIAGIAVPRRC